MSHGGMGGGGHHGGHMGHSGHSAHSGHSGGALGHSGGNHIIQHVLHALGLGHHGHGLHHGGHHGHGAAHHPDQAPNWSQAMQGEKGWKKFARINTKPFILLFFIFFGAFVWLYIIYKLHHQDAVKEGTNIIEIKRPDAPPETAAVPDSSQPAGETAQPAGEMYSPQAQAYATQAYASQYIAAATASGTAGLSSSSNYLPAGTTFGVAAPAYAAAGQAYGGAYGGTGRFGTPAYVSPYGAPMAAGQMAPQSSFGRQTQQLPANYIPAPNGRCRLVVNR